LPAESRVVLQCADAAAGAWTATFLLLSLGACESPTGLPPGAERFTPPAVYRQWWSLTEACSGLHGDFDAVQWYVVPGESTIRLADGVVSAVWVEKGNRIVLAAGPDGRYAGDLVRHEMLHALRQSGGHPREDFIGHCGGVVVCVTQCDAGPAAAPAPDPSAVTVEPAALEISVEVTSTPPAPPDTERYVMMVVSAHNPSSEAWQVQLPPSGDAGAPASFSYHLTNTTSGTEVFYETRASAPEATRFAAGETKVFIFDFWVRSGATRYDIAPGTWGFQGAYGGHWAPSAPTLDLPPREPDDQ
jgi:hypothetical protein